MKEYIEDYAVGTETTCFVDPDAPERAVLKKDSKAALYTLWFPCLFTTTAGASITGYIEREGDDIVWYRSTATPWTVPLSKKDIATREMIPTLMPAGLTASLSEEQLRDLVAYLASLKG